MSLFAKQDFSPLLLSKRWFAMKWRPNMLIRTHAHLLEVLESGLLFREDSIAVEQQQQQGNLVSPLLGRTKWTTLGERWLSGAGVATLALLVPLQIRSPAHTNICRVACYAVVPCLVVAVHRLLRTPRQEMHSLLAAMRDYTALCRRTVACLKEYLVLNRGLQSVSSILDATLRLACTQQTELAVTMSRCSSAVLANMPWLYEDVSWAAVSEITRVANTAAPSDGELVKIHHAFLVIQSTLLKHLALAHCTPSQLQRDHNERLFWLHTALVPMLTCEIQKNHQALDRMYRLLRNCGSVDALKPQSNIRSGLNVEMYNKNWLYSEIHAGIARANMELRVAVNKAASIDVFLDNCNNSQENVDLAMLNNDIDALIENLLKSISTVQSSQIKLNKLQVKLNPSNLENTREDVEENREGDEENVIKLSEKDPEIRDEVFYFVKTEEEVPRTEDKGVADIMTGPGPKEKEASKIVLSELKRKLVKREDDMIEREKRALESTMPELAGNLPVFPRQMEESRETPEAKSEVKSNGAIPKQRNLCKNQRNSKMVAKNFAVKSDRDTDKNVGAVAAVKNERYNQNNGDTLDTQSLETDLSLDSHSINLTDDSFETGLSKNTTETGASNLVLYSDSNIVIKETKCNDDGAKVSTETEIIDNEKLKTTSKPVESEISSDNKYLSDASFDLDEKDTELSDISDDEAMSEHSSNKHVIKLDKTRKEVAKYSSSSTDSDLDDSSEEKRKKISTLRDIRKHRAARRKNHPKYPSSIARSENKPDLNVIPSSKYTKRDYYSTSSNSDEKLSLDVKHVALKDKFDKSKMDFEDEGLKPNEYSFGAGVAMASMFRSGNGLNPPPSIGAEEVFVGDGEVSCDSGNDSK